MTKDKDKYEVLNLSASGNTTGNTKNCSTKSRAQVESLVLPPNSGAMKRDGIPGGVTNGDAISGMKRG